MFTTAHGAFSLALLRKTPIRVLNSKWCGRKYKFGNWSAHQRMVRRGGQCLRRDVINFLCEDTSRLLPAEQTN